MFSPQFHSLHLQQTTDLIAAPARLHSGNASPRGSLFTSGLMPLLGGLLLVATAAMAPSVARAEQAPRPIKILLVTGGCCHDYDFQTKAMQMAMKDRGVKASWTVINDGGRGTQAKIDLYSAPDWADGFDVVIHNECFANTSDADYIRQITRAHHRGVNSVVIHCAMHTYRAAKIDDWREFLGVTSRRHDHQSHYPVKVVEAEHPIMEGFPSDYRSAKDELYVIEKVWPNTTVLATSTSERDGKSHPVFWTNTYGKARVFGTTYGHSNETFQDKVFLDTLTKGTQWAAGR